jgi:hypothetical protein
MVGEAELVKTNTGPEMALRTPIESMIHWLHPGQLLHFRMSARPEVNRLDSIQIFQTKTWAL